MKKLKGEKMKYDELIKEIKKGEGFRGDPYVCPAGYPTIGYGTKLPINEDEATLLLEYRLKRMINELNVMILDSMTLKDEAYNILYDMAYNMGVPKLLKFKKMWEALKVGDYSKASDEMIDSLWFEQVGDRAVRLVSQMKALGD